MFLFSQSVKVLNLYAAYNLHSPANMGESPKSFHYGWFICENLPLLWSSNTRAELPRFGVIFCASELLGYLVWNILANYAFLFIVFS